MEQIIRLLVLLALAMPPALAAEMPADRTWRLAARLVESAPRMTAVERLKRVNDLVNAIPYRADLILYGVDDRWAGPADMFDFQAGDCEDYALAKAVLLLAMGLPPSQLYFTIEKGGWGGWKEAPMAHMKLTVFLEGDSRPYVLDNRSPFLRDSFLSPFPPPLLMIGEDGIFLGAERGRRGQRIRARDWESRLALLPEFYAVFRARLQHQLTAVELPHYMGDPVDGMWITREALAVESTDDESASPGRSRGSQRKSTQVVAWGGSTASNSR